MTVHVSERKQNLMDVQLAAIDLMTYTINEAEKDTVVSKRSRWSIGERLVDAALDIAGHIDIANSMNLNIPEEAAERRIRQDMANACVYRLKTLVRVARTKKLFPSEKEEYWIRLANEVQRLLQGWKESDRSRRRKASV